MHTSKPLLDPHWLHNVLTQCNYCPLSLQMHLQPMKLHIIVIHTVQIAQSVCKLYSYLQFKVLFLHLLLAKEAHDQINRQREDVGVVVLC